MNDRNQCCEHEGLKYRIQGLERWISKIDNRLWLILTLLVVNLAGIIGILLTALLTT